jgi:hypothetical protein
MVSLKTRRVKTLGIATSRKIKTLGTDNYMDCGKTEWSGQVHLRKKSNGSIICELFTKGITVLSKDTIGLTSFLAPIRDGKFFLPLCMRSMFKSGYIIDDSMSNKVIIEQA